MSRLALSEFQTSRVAPPAPPACRDSAGDLQRDDHGSLLAVCARCGISRTVNESRPIAALCVDCRTAERWTPEPSDSHALRGGAWVRKGLTLVYVRDDQPIPHGPKREYESAYTEAIVAGIVAGITRQLDTGPRTLAPHRICICGCLCRVIEVCPACGQTGL